MKFFTPFSIFLIFIFPTFIAHADFYESMKNRLSAVIAAKDAGLVGEGVDGLLYHRVTDNKPVKGLIEAENSDRRALFESLSRKTGGTKEEVARKFSQGIAKKAKKGHWFRKASGDWVKK